jgi:IMP dehydrogenase
MKKDYKAHTFSEVQYEPQYSEVDSRGKDVSTSTKLGHVVMDIPVVSANMHDVTGGKMVVEMAKRGGLGIMHRFMSVEENVQMFERCYHKLKKHVEKKVGVSTGVENYIGVSVGIGEGGKERFKALHQAGATTFCIDVAHGHHIHVKNMLEWIREEYEDPRMTIIAGNISTIKAAKDLTAWGADVVKVGVGPGSVCKTRQNTGVGIPQLFALERIRTFFPEVVMIADGGMKETGDIAKALKYANAVMVGSMLSGTSETPGHVFETQDNKYYKVYSGSASGESKVKSGKENSFVEGAVKTVEFRGKVKYILRKIKQNVQSTCSYQNSRTLEELREKGVLVTITNGGRIESKL